MSTKRGHHFSDDLKANPMEAPVKCSDAPAPNTPVTPPAPSVGFGDPAKSTTAGAPGIPDGPEDEAGESPAYEKSEKE